VDLMVIRSPQPLQRRSALTGALQWQKRVLGGILSGSYGLPDDGDAGRLARRRVSPAYSGDAGRAGSLSGHTLIEPPGARFVFADPPNRLIGLSAWCTLLVPQSALRSPAQFAWGTCWCS